MRLAVAVGEGGAEVGCYDSYAGYDEEEFFVLGEEFFDGVVDRVDYGYDSKRAEHAEHAYAVAEAAVAGDE